MKTKSYLKNSQKKGILCIGKGQYTNDSWSLIRNHEGQKTNEKYYKVPKVGKTLNPEFCIQENTILQYRKNKGFSDQIKIWENSLSAELLDMLEKLFQK